MEPSVRIASLVSPLGVGSVVEEFPGCDIMRRGIPKVIRFVEQNRIYDASYTLCKFHSIVSETMSDSLF
jgi:hypothetical protein